MLDNTKDLNLSVPMLTKLISRARRHREFVELKAPESIIDREAFLVLKAAYEISGLDPSLLDDPQVETMQDKRPHLQLVD